MTRAGQHRARSWVAVVAAYVLVLYGALGATLSGQSVGSLLFDRSLHASLCLTGPDGAPLGDPARQDKAHLPDCCLFGCIGSTVAGGPSPPAFSQISPPLASGVTVAISRIEAAAPPTRHRLAGRPRAPPLAG